MRRWVVLVALLAGMASPALAFHIPRHCNSPRARRLIVAGVAHWWHYPVGFVSIAWDHSFMREIYPRTLPAMECQVMVYFHSGGMGPLAQSRWFAMWRRPDGSVVYTWQRQYIPFVRVVPPEPGRP